MRYDPLQDGISSIELIDFMGGDLAIVNDARVSYNRESLAWSEKDQKLLNFLIEHKHTSPLRSTVFKFKIKATLYLARQWYKHCIASTHLDAQNSWNEVSFRYTEQKDPEFYIPKEFRTQSKTNKQGSSELLKPMQHSCAEHLYKKACQDSAKAYSDLISIGVSREIARGVLNPSVYTSWVWTASLESVLHFVKLREGSGAQSEIQKYAETIKEVLRQKVPGVCNALKLND